jgi:hypothetical protein
MTVDRTINHAPLTIAPEGHDASSPEGHQAVVLAAGEGRNPQALP